MPRPHGTIRQSQILTTYGPGAMVDLPHHAVIVGGLEEWQGEKREVIEGRLVEKAQRLLNIPNLRLFAPPVDSGETGAPPTGIGAFEFPQWVIAQHEERRGPVRSRPLVHQRSLVNGKWEAPDRKKHRVVPVRFVRACENGHIGDIDWYGFAHEYSGACRRQLWLEEGGTTGDLADVFVRCECGIRRSMAQAKRFGPEALGFCDGNRPWLGVFSREECLGATGKSLPNRLLIRSASDAYFAQVLRVISIPEASARVRDAVAALWEDFLLVAESIEDVARERRKPKVASGLEGFSNEHVWAEIQRRRGGSQPPPRRIKHVELETLMGIEQEGGDDAPEGADFFARRQTFAPTGPLALVDRIILLHRLREVLALVGFTRFESAMPDIDGELALNVRPASIARDLSWLPAVENRGEGFFISLRRQAVDEWNAKPAVRARAERLRAGFDIWQHRHGTTGMVFPGAPYLLLHSLAHMLLTAVSLGCGYSASSIRERIYASEGGYGILLYTGTSGTDGTLGGLVQAGRRLETFLARALEMARLCSNDPICAQHKPDNRQEERFLHGAACHGCLLIAEPSCERRNELLDRALVVETLDSPGTAFFAADQ
jgi:hypothetical protein